MNNNKLPEGIPDCQLSEIDEALVAEAIQKNNRREENVVKLAMHSLHEAVPYLRTVCKKRFEQDELISLGYEALLKAARNYRPQGGRFFSYAKIYLRGELNKYWRSQDVVRNASMHEPPGWISDPQPLEPQEVDPGYEQINISELWEIVQPIMRKKLTPRERMVVELVHLGGYNFTQVGKLVVPPVSREAVRICHLRALKRLRFAISEIGAL